MSKSYAELLRDPRWQKKRLEVLQRDDFTCWKCCSKEKTLNVHHCYYRHGNEPWDYPNESLVTLCEECHQVETDNGNWAKKIFLDSFSKSGWLFGHFQWVAYIMDQKKIPERDLLKIICEAVENYDGVRNG